MENCGQKLGVVLILVLFEEHVLDIEESLDFCVRLDQPKQRQRYFFMRLRQNLACSATCLVMLTVKNALNRIKAIKGFFRPRGFILETILAEAISKSSSLSSSIWSLMQFPNLSSSALPKSIWSVSKLTITSFSSSISSSSGFCSFSSAAVSTSSPFLFFLPFPFPFPVEAMAGAAFSTFTIFFPVAMLLATGGFFMMKAASLCLLSRSPTKGQESHLPLILSPETCMCISGSLHLGQQMYLSMNLSSTLLSSSSLKSPLMMQLVLFLPPASLKVVEEAFSVPNHLRMYSALVLRWTATSPRLTILVLMPLPLLSIFRIILGMRYRYFGSFTVVGMFNILLKYYTSSRQQSNHLDSNFLQKWVQLDSSIQFQSRFRSFLPHQALERDDQTLYRGMIQTAEPLSQPALSTKRIMHYAFSHHNFLGKGNFSVVYSGINEQTNLPVAIKVQDLSSLENPKILELHRSELDVLSKLSHPNVIKCYDILEEEKCCYIVTELCQEGDLDMYVKKKGVLDEETVAPFLRDILEGLLYLEQLHIVHRDLKVANVFLSGQTAKIADFGFAVFAKDNFKDANIGSPLYMSPEGFKHSIYGPKTDVWAFGALVFELLHGDTPYASCVLQKQLMRQLSIPFNRTKVRPYISPDLKQVIYRCLEISQSKRISVQELRQTTYFKRIYQQLSKSKLQQSEETQITKRVNPLQRQNNDQNRYRSIEKLYPSENGKPIKFTFNNSNSAFATAQKPFLGIHSNIPKPPQPSLPPPQLNLPPPPSPNQNQRSSKMIHFARPFSTEKQIEQSPPSLRTRVLSIDHRKPVEKYKIFNPILSFKIAVNILHYCRCLYHYLQLLIPNEPEKQLKFLSNWLILMLEQLKRKINDEEIVFDGSKRQIKMEKFREVRTDYERKYTNTLKKYLNNFISKPSLEEVKIFLFLQYRKYDFLLSKETKDCHLQIGVMSVLLYDSTRLLKKCQEENNFSRFANYKDLEEALLQSKEQFSLRTYSEIKKRILINA